mmetsp:Transcript_28881/g.42424  ORF Transcript_28881/g.42424 Transcript_28881/m.42424 type:complete len:214 (-) Transcript_28881:426-1067(-)
MPFLMPIVIILKTKSQSPMRPVRIALSRIPQILGRVLNNGNRHRRQNGTRTALEQVADKVIRCDADAVNAILLEFVVHTACELMSEGFCGGVHGEQTGGVCAAGAGNRDDGARLAEHHVRQYGLCHQHGSVVVNAEHLTHLLFVHFVDEGRHSVGDSDGIDQNSHTALTRQFPEFGIELGTEFRYLRRVRHTVIVYQVIRLDSVFFEVSGDFL